MASTYYDWHLAASQNRMNQKPLSTSSTRVNKYHHKEGLVITFQNDAGKQISMLLDNQDSKLLKTQISLAMPDDEVTRLRLAMTAIKSMAIKLGTVWGIENHMEIIENIVATANTWPDIEAQAVDAAAQAARITELEQQIKDLQDAAHQLRGIEGWIEDKDMKRHCTHTIDKLLK